MVLLALPSGQKARSLLRKELSVENASFSVGNFEIKEHIGILLSFKMFGCSIESEAVTRDPCAQLLDVNNVDN